MKIGVSSYSYNRLLGKQMTMDEIIAHAASTGFDAIEFVDWHVLSAEDPIAYAKELGEKCRAKGLEVSLMACGADFINGSNGDIAAEIQRVKGLVDITAALGAKAMRHDATGGFREKSVGKRSFADAVRIMAPAIREVTEYAATKGIRTMVENHGFFVQQPDWVEQLMLAVDHENFGWLVDFGNFACADAPSDKAVSIAAPYAFHAHVKDFLYKKGEVPKPDSSWFSSRGGNWLRGTILGHGVIPLQQCLNILKNNGYQGTLSLEFEGLEDPIDAIEKGYAYMKKIVEA